MNTQFDNDTRCPMIWRDECAAGNSPACADYVCDSCGYAEGMGPDDARSCLYGFSVDFYSGCEEPELTCLACNSKNVIAYLSEGCT